MSARRGRAFGGPLGARLGDLFVSILAGALACAPAGDAPPATPASPPPLAPTRGLVVISLDTLRADRLGAYGHPRPTSPFLDALAARAVLFERHYVQAPATLPSHMSIFTGLWPREHGVVPPALVLSPEIRTLPELLRHAGFRTAAFTEGGWMGEGFGFERGFERYEAREHERDTQVEETFARGLDFLARLGEGERFFLFLHTYSIHDPYAPPEPFRAELAPEPLPAGAPAPTGETLAAVSEGRLSLPEGTLPRYVDLYDASIRYVDSVVAELFDGLERLGLAGETTVIVTSDHGEEFSEHGRLAHTQVYPETLHVPLLLVHPGLERGVRVPALTRAIDLAPTLLELAGVVGAPPMSGASLLPLVGRPEPAAPQEAFAETDIYWGTMRTLIRREGDRFEQLVHQERHLVPTGFWVSRALAFDATAPELVFEAIAYGAPRRVEVRVDGRAAGALEVPTEWRPFHLALPGAPGTKVDVEMTTAGCTSPRELGESADTRCLSFKLKGIPVDRLELFDLARDPLAANDLSAAALSRARTLRARLDSYRHTPRAEASIRPLTEEEQAQLRALGYLR